MPPLSALVPADAYTDVGPRLTVKELTKLSCVYLVFSSISLPNKLSEGRSCEFLTQLGDPQEKGRNGQGDDVFQHSGPHFFCLLLPASPH